MRARNVARRFMIIAATLAVVSTGVAFASVTASDVIHACVGPAGVVRVVREGVACRTNERLLAWNVEGPIGPAGPPGPIGPAGPPGPSQTLITHTRFVNQEVAPGVTGVVIARCRAGEVVTGGGFGSTGGLVRVISSTPTPVSDPPFDVVPTAWVVAARNDNPTVTIQVVAYAICAPGGPT